MGEPGEVLLVIEPEQVGAARVWRYGEPLRAAVEAMRGACSSCTSSCPCWRHVDGPSIQLVDYRGLRIEGDDGEMVDTTPAFLVDCVGCGAEGVGGTLLVGPRGTMLASACESCIARYASLRPAVPSVPPEGEETK